MSNTLGSRYNNDKAPMHLLPWDAIEALAIHYGDGAKKYSERNWEKGLPWNADMASSLARHLKSWSMGEDKEYDPKLGKETYHDVAILWNAACLVAYRLRGIGSDDRPKGLTTEGKNILGHAGQGNVSNPVVPVAAPYDPSLVIPAHDVPDVVGPYDYYTETWSRFSPE